MVFSIRIPRKPTDSDRASTIHVGPVLGRNIDQVRDFVKLVIEAFMTEENNSDKDVLIMKTEVFHQTVSHTLRLERKQQEEREARTRTREDDEEDLKKKNEHERLKKLLFPWKRHDRQEEAGTDAEQERSAQDDRATPQQARETEAEANEGETEAEAEAETGGTGAEKPAAVAEGLSAEEDESPIPPEKNPPKKDKKQNKQEEPYVEPLHLVLPPCVEQGGEDGRLPPDTAGKQHGAPAVKQTGPHLTTVTLQETEAQAPKGELHAARDGVGVFLEPEVAGQDGNATIGHLHLGLLRLGPDDPDDLIVL